jgi:hypothetical protein
MSYGYVPPHQPYGRVPSSKNWLMRNKGLATVGAGAVAIGAIAAGVLVGRGSSGPPAYLATNSGQVEFITWQQAGSGIQGTIAADSITGTAPDEAVSVQSVPFTGSINGSTVTMTVNGGFLVGTRTVTATLNGSALSISFVGSSGAFQTSTLTQSTAGAYNAAVAALHSRAHQANVLAAQAQARAAQQQKQAQDEQTAGNDIASLQQDTGSLSGDLQTLAGDVKQTNKDLGTVQSDASHGPGSYCANLAGTVDADIEGTVDADIQGSFLADLQALVDGFHTVHADIATVQGDLQTVISDGGTAPPGASAAIAAAHTAITQAKSTANGDIGQVNAIDSQAYEIGNAMATGSCSGQGPGNPPAPVPRIH